MYGLVFLAFGFALGLVSGWLVFRLRSCLGSYSLRVLDLLARSSKPMSLSMIAKSLNISKQEAVNALRILVEKGLVEEDIGPGSGKVYRVRLPREGGGD